MITEMYILLKVEVEHEPGADVKAICEDVEVVYDDEDGAIMKSEVITVTDKVGVPNRK